MKIKDIALIGVLGLGGYYLYKKTQNQSSNLNDIIPPVPTTQTSPILAGIEYSLKSLNYPKETPLSTGTPAQEAIKKEYYSGKIDIKSAVQQVAETKKAAIPVIKSQPQKPVVKPVITLVPQYKTQVQAAQAITIKSGIPIYQSKTGLKNPVWNPNVGYTEGYQKLF
jgi:hypothetical protein